ncbi:MAG: ferritin family protein [Candidatus Bipolaricaulota bacterium]|nr:ferritin family protein [Candidatus Bipolaricaulota bacterium]
MSNIPFSAEETLKLAIKIEDNGRKFHEQMATDTEDEELVELFGKLAEQEKKHKKTFEEMLGETLEEGEDISSLLYGKLEDSYLDVLADSKVFTSANENIQAAKQASNRGELLGIAISLAKDKILYYYELLDKATSDRDRGIIEDIIKQEKSLIKLLANSR